MGAVDQDERDHAEVYAIRDRLVKLSLGKMVTGSIVRYDTETAISAAVISSLP